MPTAEQLLKHKGEKVVTVDKGASVLEAAKAMNDHRIGAVIVTSVDQAVGIFTERDILTRVVVTQRSVTETKVGDVMTSSMACCTRATKLTECKAVMTDKKIRHLPVVEEGKLYGIISSGDILANEVAHQENTIQYLSEYLYGRS
ncbi:MAG TPA: CBS domain-containing protein [Phycisphaerae bacterium]|nr:CBS domain-containing protein [Phycisphaerae bacterium]